MPSFSRSLEQTCHRALALAGERHHEYASLEHLLLALIDDQDAAVVMRACDVEVDTLRRELIKHLDTDQSNFTGEGRRDAKPRAEFQRVIQRAVIHVQSSGRDEVTGVDILLAIVRPPQEPVAVSLADLGLTTYDVTLFAAHGISKDSVVEGAQSGIALDGELVRIVLKNDDFTPMEFVVHVVERFFDKTHEDARQVMMHVHQNGVGECGLFTYEVAETKVTQVMDFARKHRHPLLCVMEKK